MNRKPDPKPKAPPIEINAAAINELQMKMAAFLDIELSNPQDGDILVFDGATGRWTNGSVTVDLGEPI